MRRLPPVILPFLREYLASEKAVCWGDQWVVNSNFPPIPSPAWERFVDRLGNPGEYRDRLFSITWAVTNRCSFHCWHCYNADRTQTDCGLDSLKRVAGELEAAGAIMLHLTGGEPLLRPDLEQIAGFFGSGVCVSVGTTGLGLTPERARSLAAAGVFSVGISLDSDQAAEHDAKRGYPGAFKIALEAIANARQAGLYCYVVTVASRELLVDGRFERFLQFVEQAGAFEVHLLEPCPAGRLQGRQDVILEEPLARKILELQSLAARDVSLPILSTYARLESPDSFGCGAGTTHLYVDGGGEVCPCQLVPYSFGNLLQESLPVILERLHRHVPQPRLSCLGRDLRGLLPAGQRPPAPPHLSEKIFTDKVAPGGEMPRFFRVLESRDRPQVDNQDLERVYNQASQHYDGHWLSQAGGPVRELFGRLEWKPGARLFEAGCGTGYATALAADKLGGKGDILAVDLSPGMLAMARQRLEKAGWNHVRLVCQDALEALSKGGSYDLIITTWVLGYIPLAPFMKAACAALAPGGQLALVVHQQQSPREALEVFSQLVAANPEALEKEVHFDFPPDLASLERHLRAAGLELVQAWPGQIVFPCGSATEAVEHLLHSGAGTAYQEAIRPSQRPELTRRFQEELARRHAGGPVPVAHDYFSAIAVRPQ